ncbi:baculoviral IAP repeat-containing protein 7-B isoform X2 [Colias croceus]|uniref:baculoviral IAP repeat-containing protein 7-B isoform X2 n=1 Tax=Colias crocea TaxID=72248 RepID=UPI001E27FD8E|nr:baculoviral IAP repeat-containing protein 7-B isoform X2 [Colias croceus]
MNIESNRLNTFTNWPASAPVDPIRIARAGFFYTGNGCEVECFSCRGKISEWNYGDQVMWRHRLLSPNCSFVLTPQLSGNIPSVPNQGCVPVNDAPNVASESVDEQSYVPEEYGVTAEDQMYRSDALRLLSYVNNWNDSSISREALVNAGFYHAGGGRLRCAWCGGELAPFRNLGSLGSPLEIHRRYFPNCEFAIQVERRDNERTSPLSPSYESSYSPPPTSEAAPQTNGGQNEQVVAAGSAWRELGVVSGGARHPTKASLPARLATFDRWPYDRPQAPQSLAEAGFFYTGVEDQVRCFYCDGGLGKWEAGDVPWREHARWFPQCGYVLLLKGQHFVDEAQRPETQLGQKMLTSDRNSRVRNSSNCYPVTEAQIEAAMESEAAVAALGAGLDVARVRRAILRRLRSTGVPYPTSDGLIDAILDEQLDEEPWSMSPRSHRYARDILTETLRIFENTAGVFMLPSENADNRISSSDSQSSSPMPPEATGQSVQVYNALVKSDKRPEKSKTPVPVEKKELTLEEENRQLKEARLCKVCMDSEVSMVFLPCGHLVSCAACSAALAACPLCRAAVKALVRAYFA